MYRSCITLYLIYGVAFRDLMNKGGDVSFSQLPSQTVMLVHTLKYRIRCIQICIYHYPYLDSETHSPNMGNGKIVHLQLDKRYWAFQSLENGHCRKYGQHLGCINKLTFEHNKYIAIHFYITITNRLVQLN